jgi:hypothetical protein
MSGYHVTAEEEGEEATRVRRDALRERLLQIYRDLQERASPEVVSMVLHDYAREAEWRIKWRREQAVERALGEQAKQT